MTTAGKKHVKPDPKWGFLHRCAEENFPALHDIPTVSMAYHQPSFKMLFILFVHSAFFNCCSLPEQIHTGKLLIFQPTL